MAEADLKTARAIALATEIRDAFDSSPEPVGDVAFKLGDKVQQLCGYLRDLGATPDADSIAEHAQILRRAAVARAYTKAAERMPAGPLDDERTLREQLDKVLPGHAQRLRDRVVSVLQTLADKAADARKPTTAKRRGRPKANYDTEQREAQFAADWKRAKEAGTYKIGFAKQHGLTVKQLDALLDRVSKRNRASE